MIPLLSTVPYGIRIAFDGFSVIDSRPLESQVKRAMRSVSPQTGLAGEILERPILDRLRDSIVSIDFEQVRKTCEEALTSGIPPTRVISEGMAPGMNIVGEKFQAGEYFIPDLIAAGAAMEEGLKILEPHLQKGEEKKIGKIVLGTVEGDLHSIGKDIVSMLLRTAGFVVVDLGVDVSADRFVEAVRVERPRILGMSALVTITMPQMRNVIERLQEAGLKGQLRVILGGAPVSNEFAETVGANAYAPDAVAGVNICKEWVARGDLQ